MIKKKKIKKLLARLLLEMIEDIKPHLFMIDADDPDPENMQRQLAMLQRALDAKYDGWKYPKHPQP